MVMTAFIARGKSKMIAFLVLSSYQYMQRQYTPWRQYASTLTEALRFIAQPCMVPMNSFNC